MCHYWSKDYHGKIQKTEKYYQRTDGKTSHVAVGFFFLMFENKIVDQNHTHEKCQR